MNTLAAVVYWVIVLIWLSILSTVAWFYLSKWKVFGTTRLLLAVLGLDAVRNIIENTYFGLYFGSKYAIFSPVFAQILGNPYLLILPKLANVAAGCVVMGLLLMRWLPEAIRERADIERQTREKVESELKLATIMDHIPGYIYQRVMRIDGLIELVYCSPSLCKLLGIKESDVTRRFYDYVHPEDLDGLNAAIRSSAADMSIFREEFRLVSTSGAVHWLRSDAPPRRTATGEIVWDGLAIEISSEKWWQSEIANQALRDPLTGLLNRTAWRQALTIQLNAKSAESPRVGVLCIDIKGFRDLNYRLGQHVGDEILRATAQRLVRIAESVAGATVRLGGDEFAILVPSCSGEEALSSLARSASKALVLPVKINEKLVTIQTYIGAALCERETLGMSADDDVGSELMMQAEIALRWAKQEGRNAHVFYSRERDDRFQNRALLARSLEQAITNDELDLHYQPLVDLSSGRIVSIEALVRWNHSTLGLQRPDLFIPIAETSGMIVQLGRWVFDRALRQRRQWQDEGLAPPPIAVNVSGTQLLDPGFIAYVEQSLRSMDANPMDFEIELIETVLIEPSPQVMAALINLRTMGFKITVDDFGSGHASFGYLRDFPIDKLKIDQMFIRKLTLQSKDALLIRAVISLARSLGIDLVAEGIETEMQRAFLEHEGCPVGQGYFFSPPLVAEDFASMLANDVRLPLHA